MKGKIAVMKDRIAAMFVMLAETGASLPGAAIRPPQTTQSKKLGIAQAYHSVRL